MKGAAAFVSGFLLVVGLALAGMTQPEKILAFLDFFGSWDASLLFTMGGAVAVFAIGYRLALRFDRPLLESEFQRPTKKQLDWPVVAGSALFGIGWGLAGYCPGPALASVVTAKAAPWIFVGSMLLGMGLYEWVQGGARQWFKSTSSSTKPLSP